MHPLLAASFITLTTLLVDLRGKCKQPINRYIALFFLIAGIGYFFQAMKAEASEIEPYRRYLRSKDEPGFVLVIKDETPKKTKRQIDKELVANCLKKANSSL